jgi:phospholipase/carboxylesterase
MGPLHYIVRPPAAENPQGSQPLLVLLHGYGSNEEDLLGLAPYLDPGFLIVSVRAPHPLDFGGFAWFPIDFTPNGLVLHYDLAREARDRVAGLVEVLQREHPVDRTYLLGFSQGASMVMSTALVRPELCAGVVFLSGICVEEMMPEGNGEALQGLPVLMTHGRQDMVIPIHQGRTARALLRRLPLDLTCREYDMGHEINPECLADTRDWLQRRLEEDR